MCERLLYIYHASIFVHRKLLQLLCGNCIGGVMVSVLTSSAVDRGFKPRSCQTKDYKLALAAFLFMKQEQRSRKMCPSRAVCLHTYCCARVELYVYTRTVVPE